MILLPHAAYNLYLQTSMLLLDACSTQEVEHPNNDDEDPPVPENSQTSASSTPNGAMPGSAWLDASLTMHEAAARAREWLLDELTPDDTTQAIVLFDNEERARQLAAWLRVGDGGCKRVHLVERAALHRLYPFLFRAGAQSLTLPNEIIPRRLFLGAAVTANAEALRLLRITHVVSLLDRSIATPRAPVGHLLVRIVDTPSADMDGALLEALPVIEAALREPEGRVLVHCEAGQSRSATVVVAALMANIAQMAPAPSLGVDEALALVAAQRPNVRPNDGFKACLKRAAWMPSAPAVEVDYF